jgi:hypothetical protein
MRSLHGLRCAWLVTRLALAATAAVAAWSFLGLPAAMAQAAPVEVTQTDITKLNSLESSQWTVLGVRLGDTKEAALKTLQRTGDVKVQDDAAAGRIFVSIPPPNSAVVMSLKVTQGLVTTINLVGGFGEWLQGDTRLLFRAFEDDSLRYKLLGREDQREVVKGGTTEAPTVDMSFAYFKEGILLHYGIKRSADGKQVEILREMVLIYPPKAR